MEFKKSYLTIPLLVILILLIALYGLFSVYKKASYEMLYEDLVQQTVKDMVKPEYLIEDYKK